MKNLDYTLLIHNELIGELSASDSVLLQQWKEAHEDNMATYHDTVEIWKLSAGYTPKLNIDVNKAFQSQMDRIKKDSEIFSKPSNTQTQEAKVLTLNKTKWIMRVAAIMAVILSATILFRSGDMDFKAIDQVRYVQLSDGSSIWLDKGSTLSVDGDFGDSKRSVSLEGKAFFDIQRDENRPFVISADELNVTVLGTSFTVDAADSEPSVSVKTGKVNVKVRDINNQSPNGTNLVKGQQLILSNDNVVLNEDIDMSSFNWTNPDLSFKNAPLSEVLADLSKHFEIDFIYKGGVNLEACPFTSKSLAKASLSDVIEILELTYDMKITKKSEKEMKLSHIRCRK